MRRLLSVVVCLALAAPAIGVAAPKGGGVPGKKMVCWTDDQGLRACGDRVPPEYAKGEREVFDAQGRVVEKKVRQKTPEEVAEIERKAAAAVVEAARAEKQTRYDKYLLQTFGSVAELEGARDARLRTVDSLVNINEKSVTDAEASLKTLQARAEAQKKDGKEPDARLLKQIKQFEGSLVDGLKAREQKKKERAEIIEKFGTDIARYKKLRTHEIQIGSAPEAPPAASAPPKP